jgi:hypothetical protein
MRGGWGAALAASMTLFWALGAMANDDKVDCSRLSLGFPPAAQADWTECYRFHDADVPDGEGAESRSADYEIIVTDLKSHVVHLVSADAGPNTYFDKKPASQLMKEFDELERVANTESEEGFKRYQVVRFRASLWKTPVTCFGFVKYGGGAIAQGGTSAGAATLLAGYDCWRDGTPNREQIESTLGAIDD